MSLPNEVQIGKVKTNPKQLATIGIFAVVVLVILWQVKGLFGGGSSAPVTPVAATTPAKMNMAAAGPATPSAAPSGNMGASAMPPAQPDASQEVGNGTPRPAAVQSNSDLVKLQKQTEEKYLAAINELQMLKVQQAIAETNQAIATSKLATVTSEKGITDLLTKPSSGGGSEASAYANNLVSPVASGTSLPGMMPPTTLSSLTPPAPIKSATPPPVPDMAFQVLSVSYQGGKWNAVMGGSGKLFTVSIGDVLPDGSAVYNISKEGVVLEKDSKKRKISMSSLI